MGITIRHYISSDTKGLLSCVKEFRKYLIFINPDRKKNLPDEFFQKWMEERQREIAGGTGSIFVATENNEIVGYTYGLIIKPQPHELNEYNPVSKGEIVDIYVKAQAQSKGVGKLLVSTINKHFQDHGCTQASLLVLSTNKKALSFYEHLGFTHDAIEMVFKFT